MVSLLKTPHKINEPVSTPTLLWAEAGIAVVLSLLPLFFSFPYRINLFLAWEGAYRLAEGQIPFRDFGMPLGYGFWLVPALFFKLFGASMYTLIIAQAFINLVSVYFFRSLLKLLGVRQVYILFSVFIFCLSYSFINFWPWYNHTVFVYELIGLYFLLLALLKTHTVSRQYFYLSVSAFFIFLSFFTKQDGGALAVALAVALLVYISAVEKNVRYLAVFLGAFIVIGCAFILPLLAYDFAYWFNYGQPPHYSRLNIMDFVNQIFRHSMWEKFYLLVIVFIGCNKLHEAKSFVMDRREMLFFLLTLGILVQALLVQVTSYIPHNVNVYFHSFAFAYIISNLRFRFDFARPAFLLPAFILLFFWWSGDYWKYGERVLRKILPSEEVAADENVVSRNTWKVEEDTVFADRSQWVLSSYPSFRRMYMPEETVAGIDRIMQMEVVRQDSLQVLNMTELTPLARELGYQLEASPAYPLWFHQGVAFFDREAGYFCEKIERQHYDLILFQTIPNLNNFFPYAVRDCIQQHYTLTDRFLAPREIPNSHVEVYVRRQPAE